MSKTDLTKELEKGIYDATNKTGIFGCFEVTIGFYGRERVDYVTYDTKGIWRFYEIKVSKEDFHSKAKVSFLGHFNYYVMPVALYEEVKDEIPDYVGVFTGSAYIKRAKKQELSIDENILKDSMIRSLNREKQKFIKTCDTGYINRLTIQIEKLRKEARENCLKYRKLTTSIFELCEKYSLNYMEVREFLRNL